MYLILSIIILLTVVIYYGYIRPKKMCQHYIHALRAKGYKVAELPFKMMGLAHWGLFKKDEKQKKDAFWTFKNQFQGCDVVVSNILMYPFISILKIDLLKELFTPDKLTSLHKSELGLSLLLHLSGNSLFLSNDDVWKNKKKILSKVFNYQFIASQIPNIAQICDDAYDKIASKMANNNEGTVQIKLTQLSSNIFQSVISMSFFGVQNRNTNVNGKTIQQLLLQSSVLITDCSKDFLVFLFGPIVYQLGIKSKYRKLKSNINTLRTLAKQFISQINTKMTQNNQQNYKCNNVLQWLQYLKGKQANQFVYSDNDIVDQLLTFFAAATDTTTYFFAMTILFVYQNKDIQERLRTQIGNLFDRNQNFTMENLKKMEYIDWLQYETMRMFGPTIGCFIRRPVKSIQIGGITVGNDAVINYNCKTNFHDKNIYENPFEFNPQRWNPQKNPNCTHLLNDLLMLGFSGGPRSCIGRQLALVQSKIALIKFVLRFTNLKEVNQRIVGFNFMTYLPECYIRMQKCSAK